jgi:magnesium-transporting ATPase (P-type)
MQEIKTEEIQPSWHHISVDLALGELGAAPAGLSQHEAEARLKTHGHNRLPEPPKRSTTIRFLYGCDE